ncbi:hypothetical protein [Cohnella fermenti]|uniref:Uncharacterized protein n=1 Tax=Cohnella fermenti TaxID=2565925 RepID=A0A4S4BHR9_9BACL|nr:hypothetical protein [Cohnella fermenti]THF73872.1 hypothetical protein E6C55_27570 [Cohnella fermenti]
MNKHLWNLPESEAGIDRLLAIAARHVKLALEYLNRSTSYERKQAICIEIAALRAEREALLHDSEPPHATNKILLNSLHPIRNTSLNQDGAE